MTAILSFDCTCYCHLLGRLMGTAASFQTQHESKPKSKNLSKYNAVEMMAKYYSGDLVFDKESCDCKTPVEVTWSHRVGSVYKYKSGLVISNDPTIDIQPSPRIP